MKFFLFALILIAAVPLAMCKDDDARTCTVCDSEDTQRFELCRETNGRATVNGEDTGVGYDVYFAGLQEVGVQCGG
ncbi:MAG: hypothetical protein ACPG7E_07370 [Marinirhabdus sp.]